MELAMVAKQYRTQREFWVWEMYRTIQKPGNQRYWSILQYLTSTSAPTTVVTLSLHLNIPLGSMEQIILRMIRCELLSRSKERSCYYYKASDFGRLVVACHAPQPRTDHADGRRNYQRHDWQNLDQIIATLRKEGLTLQTIAVRLDIPYTTLSQRESRKQKRSKGESSISCYDVLEVVQSTENEA